MSEHIDHWGDCPPGELRRMVGRIQESRRREITHRITSVLAVFAVVAAGVWLGTQLLHSDAGVQGKLYGSLTCAQVESMFTDYGRGVMSEGLEQRIAAHLRQCDHCREIYEAREGSKFHGKPLGAGRDRRTEEVKTALALILPLR